MLCFVYLKRLPMLIYLSVAAIETCYGLDYMGFSSYWKKYCWDGAQSSAGDAKEFSGMVHLYVVVRLIGLKKKLYLTFLMWFIWQVSEFCNQFYRTYFLTIEQEIFAVLTDTFHKPGFKLHVLVLQHLFCLVYFSPIMLGNVRGSSVLVCISLVLPDV